MTGKGRREGSQKRVTGEGERGRGPGRCGRGRGGEVGSPAVTSHLINVHAIISINNVIEII